MRPTVFVTAAPCSRCLPAPARPLPSPTRWPAPALEFQAAYAAAGAGTAGAAVAPDSDALRAYPLYPYLQAARLRQRIADPAAAGEIEAFLKQHGDAPYARSLRRSWLMSLAEAQGVGALPRRLSRGRGRHDRRALQRACGPGRARAHGRPGGRGNRDLPEPEEPAARLRPGVRLAAVAGPAHAGVDRAARPPRARCRRGRARALPRPLAAARRRRRRSTSGRR